MNRVELTEIATLLLIGTILRKVNVYHLHIKLLLKVVVSISLSTQFADTIVIKRINGDISVDDINRNKFTAQTRVYFSFEIVAGVNCDLTLKM